MVSRAENDWMEKQEALEKLKSINDTACSSLLDLMVKLNVDLAQTLYRQDNADIISLIDILAQEIDATIVERKNTQEKMHALENNYDEACRHIEIMNEEKMELSSLSIHMAHKLDDIRKNVFFEVTNQLQLSVDENEVGAMTRKITALDSERQDDSSIYNEILMATNVIDNAKFVSRIFKKVRNAHDLTRRWQKEYKDLKEKYSRLTTSAHSKIAFRNFKVGDVALFLPTRNSSGRPWAAFNVNAPHYFLKPSDTISGQMNSREWIVARITSITECVAIEQDPSTNPYALPDNAVYYQLEVENWRNGRQKHHQKKSKSEKVSSSSTPTTTTSTTSSTVNINEDDPHTTLKRRSTLPNINSSHHRHPGIGLASISSSTFEISTHQNATSTKDQQQHSSSSHQATSSSTRESKGNIVHSTTIASPSPSSSPPHSDDPYIQDNSNRPNSNGSSSPSSPAATDPFTI
ncbi:autophagy-related protein 11-domain-containing protein [Chlamydoabsidia padenii]|nr:autophagy-related protein 11-domain-containing protein [Chlamydoabsidia padenii]